MISIEYLHNRITTVITERAISGLVVNTSRTRAIFINPHSGPNYSESVTEDYFFFSRLFSEEDEHGCLAARGGAVRRHIPGGSAGPDDQRLTVNGHFYEQFKPRAVAALTAEFLCTPSVGRL